MPLPALEFPKTFQKFFHKTVYIPVLPWYYININY
ncbi:hypothetical protein G3F10_244 [Escherichia phage vB_EcoM-G3F10]|nr:hypothetical protein CHD94UKE2_245 [Escherichia phage vB_EcoM-CHD94UKE2]QZI81922.1 hypothetical protein G3F7_245 [Escherichia phage vB_EcoM-G3F7]QZI82791.1 hypothetical protein G3F10_244 [Escherichia phage vB_EcoM-G3F10]